jgi:hypothetical protein
MDAMNVRELEETLTRLDSVDAVRIVTEGDKVAEVHVLATPTKTAKQVVRDVQSLAMARFGANIDRRVISVVQISPEGATMQPSERPALVSIKEEPNGTRNTVHVTLAWQGDEHRGTASGPIASSARLRLIGEAAIRAIENLFEEAPALALDAVGTSSVGMRTVLIAVVVSSTDRGEETSVGSALSHGDESEAAVRAVLDAINRRIPALMS